MTTLTWPTGITPHTVDWHLEANTGSFVSPLTRAVQTTELAGARWVAEMTLPTMQRDTWRAWAAFAARMRGQAGRVYVKPWHGTGSSAPTFAAGLELTCDSTATRADSTTPTTDARYPASLGTPLINGASQTGADIVTDGWAPSAMIFEQGDFFCYDTTAGRTLHMVVEYTESDINGEATLSVEPPIRTSPADNAALNISTPTCVMRLKDDSVGALSVVPGYYGNVNISLVETF